jgi:cytoskeletal protein CcmA (bactofilin family)
MIFGKDKKNSSPENTNSVEDNAIDRWRSLNNSPKSENLKEEITNSDQNNSRRTSYLSSLISNNSDNTSSAAETIKLTIQENEATQASFLEHEESEEIEEKVGNSTVLNLETVFEEDSEDELEKDQPQQITKTVEPIITKEPKIKIPSGDFNLDVEEDLINRFGSNLKLALGEGTMIDGVFSFESPVKVEGTLTGEIKSESALIVGKKAKIKAKIKVGSLVVIGRVEGEIEAEDLVEIRSTGSIYGDIITKRISLEEGGLLNGSCTILD